MSRCLLLLAVLALGAASPARSSEPELHQAQGRLVLDTDSVELHYAYGWTTTEPFGAHESRLHVLLSDRPLDTNKLDHYQSMDFAVGNMARARKAAFVEIEFARNDALHALFPGTAAEAVIYGFSESVPKGLTASIARQPGGDMTVRITAREPIDFRKEGGKPGHMTIEATGKVRIADRTPSGQPLPPEGGEPAQAYRALNQARANADFDAMARYLDDPNAAELATMRKNPDWAAAFEEMKRSLPSTIEIRDGHVDGINATFTSVGTKRDGSTTRARVYMIKEGGSWKLAEEIVE